MGRGKGGYTTIQTNYKDSGGRKVTDKGTIFVAERYIDLGYEVVFRQRQDEIDKKNFDRNYSEPPHFNKAIPLLRSKPDIVINI